MKFRTLLILSLFLFSTAACNLTTVPPNPAELTAAAATLNPATPTAEQPFPTATQLPPPTTVPPTQGTGVTITIPPGLASSAQSEIVTEYIGLDQPAWQIHPAYTHITLQGYPLQSTFFKPEIYVFPADDFTRVSPGAAQIISNLKAMLGTQGANAEPMPFLPLFNDSQVFHSNVVRISFQNGVGFRYLTQRDQAPLPVNNHELIYTFQGLTQDGRYYISAILPVNTGFLSVDGNPQTPLPSDGIPFDWNHLDQMPVYLNAVKQRLESTPPEAFGPSLTALDALIQSMRVDLP